MTFHDPIAFAILPVLIIFFFILKRIYPENTILFPSDDFLRHFGSSPRLWVSRHIGWFRAVSLILMVTALARPQMSRAINNAREGIAFVFAIDCSSTMLAEDLQLGRLGLANLVEKADSVKRLSRIDALRGVVLDFIRARPNDMIGIVAFAAQAYAVCPPTLDRDWLSEALGRVKVGLIKDATAIGSGILSGLDSLKGVRAREKVIILLTDGINNYGEVPPLIAAKAARALGVKIYAIGIAGRGLAPFPVKDAYGRITYTNIQVDMDEESLKKIASTTGGAYYRVTDMRSLKESYKDIDDLERSRLEEDIYKEDEDIYLPFLLWAAAFLLFEILIRYTYARRIP